MQRRLRYSDQAYDALEELEDRGDEDLLDAVNDLLDLIEDGDGTAKRGPYDLTIDGTAVRGWLATTTVRGTTWAVAWSVIDDHRAKIHAITPTESF